MAARTGAKVGHLPDNPVARPSNTTTGIHIRSYCTQLIDGSIALAEIPDELHTQVMALAERWIWNSAHRIAGLPTREHRHTELERVPADLRDLVKAGAVKMFHANRGTILDK
jgi:hypothetical protein